MTTKDLEALRMQGAIILPKQVGLTVAASALLGALWLGYQTSEAAGRITHLEVRDKEQRERIDERASANARRIDALEGMKDRVIRIEGKIDSLGELLVRLEARADRR